MSERFDRAGYDGGLSSSGNPDLGIKVTSGFAGDKDFVKGKEREEKRKATLAETKRFSDENARQARQRISNNAGNRSNETGKSVSEQLAEARALKLSREEQDDIQDFFQASNEYEDNASEQRAKKTEADLKGGLDIELGGSALTKKEENSRRIELTTAEKIAIMSAKIDAMDESNTLADKSTKSPDAGFHRSMSAKDSQIIYDDLKSQDNKSVIKDNESFDEQQKTAESVKAQKYADKLEKNAQKKGFFSKIKSWFR